MDVTKSIEYIGVEDAAIDLFEGRYPVKRVKHPHSITAEVPGSKSITNRAFLLAALAEGRSVLYGVLFSDDSRHFLAALCNLGFEVETDEAAHTVAITGCGGRIPKREATVDVGSAGTAARFLTAFLGFSDGRYRMDSSEQMKKRPMQELLEALTRLGADVSYEGEEYHFPYTIGHCREEDSRDAESHNQKTGHSLQEVNEITIDVDKSSQFLSALLIVSVLFSHDFTIHVTGSHGMAYVRMTVEMMRQFGLSTEVSADERTYRIPADASYQPKAYRIEPDVSAAGYFYAAGALLGVPAKVLHVHRDSMQGDIQFLNVLCDMGCRMQEQEDGIILLPEEETSYGMQGRGQGEDSGRAAATGRRLHGGSWDLSSFSDQALTLAAIAPFADSSVRIRGIGHIRFQECDRIAAIIENLCAMGVRCVEEDGNMIIDPPEVMHGAEIHTFDDHRVAMAFTLPGLLLDGQIIMNPACCRKTFENYFDVLETALY